MKVQTIEYFKKEFKMLKDYYDEFGSSNAIINMKEDRIIGAYELAEKLGLIDYTSFTELRKEIMNN